MLDSSFGIVCNRFCFGPSLLFYHVQSVSFSSGEGACREVVKQHEERFQNFRGQIMTQIKSSRCGSMAEPFAEARIISIRFRKE